MYASGSPKRMEEGNHNNNNNNNHHEKYMHSSSSWDQSRLVVWIQSVFRSVWILIVILCVIPAILSYFLLRHSARVNNVCFVSSSTKHQHQQQRLFNPMTNTTTSSAAADWSGIYQSFGHASYYYLKVFPPSMMMQEEEEDQDNNYYPSTTVWTTSMQWSPRYIRNVKKQYQYQQQQPLLLGEQQPPPQQQQQSSLVSPHAITWDDTQSRWCFVSKEDNIIPRKEENSMEDLLNQNNNNNNNMCTDQVPSILADASVAPYFAELPLSPPPNSHWYPSNPYSNYESSDVTTTNTLTMMKDPYPISRGGDGLESTRDGPLWNILLDSATNPRNVMMKQTPPPPPSIHVSCHVASNQKSLSLSANGFLSHRPEYLQQMIVPNLLELPTTLFFFSICFFLYIQSKAYVWYPKFLHVTSTIFASSSSVQTLFEIVDELFCGCFSINFNSQQYSSLLSIQQQQQQQQQQQPSTTADTHYLDSWNCWIQSWVHPRTFHFLYNLYNLYWLGATLEEDIASIPYLFQTITFLILSILTTILLHYCHHKYFISSKKQQSQQHHQDNITTKKINLDNNSDHDILHKITNTKSHTKNNNATNNGDNNANKTTNTPTTTTKDVPSITFILKNSGLTPVIMAWMMIVSLERSALIPFPPIYWMVQVPTTFGIFNPLIAIHSLIAYKICHVSMYAIIGGSLVGCAWHYMNEIVLFNTTNATYMIWSPNIWIPLACWMYVYSTYVLSFTTSRRRNKSSGNNSVNHNSTMRRTPSIHDILLLQNGSKNNNYNGCPHQRLYNNHIDSMMIMDDHDQTALEEAVDMEIQNFFHSDNDNFSVRQSSLIRPMSSSMERYFIPPALLLSMLLMTWQLYNLQDYVMMYNQVLTLCLWANGIHFRFLQQYLNNDHFFHPEQRKQNDIAMEHIFRCIYLCSCANIVLDAMTLGSNWTDTFTYLTTPSMNYDGSSIMMMMMMMTTSPFRIAVVRMMIQFVCMFLSASILQKRCTSQDDPCLFLLPFSMASVFDHAKTVGNTIFATISTTKSSSSNNQHSSSLPSSSSCCSHFRLGETCQRIKSCFIKEKKNTTPTS